ncbi:hypothetical protein, partial [Salmonella enterica]|uniref:hypothetical protein n=1 Tax=Salmonella enterica TaxID=28901 RepID=UPI003297A379
LQVFRRWPMTEAGREAMLRYGELALRAGHMDLARRSFDDAAAWASAGEGGRFARRGRELASPPRDQPAGA